MSIEQEKLSGLTDAHMHVYEDGYPLSPKAYHAPEPGSTLADYRREMARLGVERAVIVHPTAYGTDNSCTADAVMALGGAGRGIALLDDDASHEEIERLGRQGMVGARFFTLNSRASTTWDAFNAIAHRVVEHGWHSDIGFDGRDLLERYDVVSALPGTVVIEHFGLYLDLLPIDSPEVGALLRLLDTGRFWVKLSSPYAGSETGAPHYRDVETLGRKLLSHAPERCVWGSNWPHAGFTSLNPDAKQFLQAVTGWAGDPAIVQKLLVDNPAHLYGF